LARTVRFELPLRIEATPPYTVPKS
jgi:hypothetical protein